MRPLTREEIRHTLSVTAIANETGVIFANNKSDRDVEEEPNARREEGGEGKRGGGSGPR